MSKKFGNHHLLHTFENQSTFKMNSKEEQLNTLSEIRNMMDRSSRFISLSGLSGIFAGLTALIGAYFAQKELNTYQLNGKNNTIEIETSLIKIALVVFLLALIGAFLFTLRETNRKKLPIWDKTTKNLLISLSIPLAVGAFYVFALLFNGIKIYSLIAPTCLFFYGLGLINASKYTLKDIKYLGICQLVLGVIAVFFSAYGLYFWTIGFGLLHIIYGSIMYFKYEKV